MKNKILFCFLLSLLAAACGKVDEADKSSVVQNEQPQKEDGAPPSKYSVIILETNEHQIEMFTHTLRLSLGRRPLLISGTLNDERTEKSCQLQFVTRDVDATKLEALANRLEFCIRDWEFEDEAVNFTGTNSLTATQRVGGTRIFAYKNDLGEDLHIDQTWVCGGKSAFYSYVKSLVRPKLADSCPEDALSKF